jgi:hypothetical protein
MEFGEAGFFSRITKITHRVPNRQAAKKHEVHDDVNWTPSVIELTRLAAFGE